MAVQSKCSRCEKMLDGDEDKTTYEDIVAEFETEILPGVIHVYEADGVRDIPARSEAWNNYTDYVCREGRITTQQYETWGHPPCCNR